MADTVSPSVMINATGAPRYVARSTVLAARFGVFLILGLITYVLALVASGWAMPQLMAGVADGMGMDFETATLAGYAVWMMSSAVLVLLVSALVLVAVRAMWRLSRRVIAELEIRLGLRGPQATK